MQKLSSLAPLTHTHTRQNYYRSVFRGLLLFCRQKLNITDREARKCVAERVENKKKLFALLRLKRFRNIDKARKKEFRP